MSDDCLHVSTRNYDKPFPNYEQPRIIGEYSVTKRRQVVSGRKLLRHLNENLVDKFECNFDLSEGYSTFEKKDDLVNEKLDILLSWIIMNTGSRKELKKVCCNADIVCWRGLLTKIAAFPYEKREGFRVVVVRFKSVVFLCEFDTEEKIERLKAMSKRELLMTYWGFKFEQYITLASPGGIRDTSEPVNNNEEFSVIFQTALGNPDKIRIFFSAEVDCINSKSDYVELKTQRQGLDESFWKFKAIKWWLQSFLVGIKEIVVGFRKDNGVVFRTQKVMVSQLANRNKYWSANVAFNFLHTALKLIKHRLDQSRELEYYLIDFFPGKSKLDIRPLPPDLPFQFLPDYFIKHFST